MVQIPTIKQTAFIVSTHHKPESQCKSLAVVSSFPCVQFFPVYAVPEYCPKSGGNFGTSQSVPSSAPPPTLHPSDEAATKTSFKQKESETMREREDHILYRSDFFFKEINTYFKQGGFSTLIIIRNVFLIPYQHSFRMISEFMRVIQHWHHRK